MVTKSLSIADHRTNGGKRLRIEAHAFLEPDLASLGWGPGEGFSSGDCGAGRLPIAARLLLPLSFESVRISEFREARSVEHVWRDWLSVEASADVAGRVSSALR